MSAPLTPEKAMREVYEAQHAYEAEQALRESKMIAFEDRQTSWLRFGCAFSLACAAMVILAWFQS